MVLLSWKAMESNSPGITAAPGIIVPRICIQLNSTPFEDDDADIDEILDALIHQMIHAYFLVCCGPQRKGTEQDGRLLDGVHFGVILSTINDITKLCNGGSLRMVFHAAHRAIDTLADEHGVSPMSPRAYISIDPRGNMFGPPPADGRSHCMRDNRNISRAQVLNWQVEEYSRCIDEDMQARGDTIYDLGVDGKLKEVARLAGPPSADYVELIWDGKRIMAPREKMLCFASLRKAMEETRFNEISLPGCPMSVLHCLWDFIQHSFYWKQQSESRSHECGSRREAGPPVLLSPHGRPGEGIQTHIQVFKTADSMRFEELQKYALERLYDLPTASDDPIAALKLIYEGDARPGIAYELQSWARKFLARTDEPASHAQHRPHHLARPGHVRARYRGVSNYEKLLTWHRDRFLELYHRSRALKEDCQLVVAGLHAGYDWAAAEDHPHAPPYCIPHGGLPLLPPLRRSRSVSGFLGPDGATPMADIPLRAREMFALAGAASAAPVYLSDDDEEFLDRALRSRTCALPAIALAYGHL